MHRKLKGAMLPVGFSSRQQVVDEKEGETMDCRRWRAGCRSLKGWIGAGWPEVLRNRAAGNSGGKKKLE